MRSGMPMIPAELLPILASPGIIDPAANRWEARES